MSLLGIVSRAPLGVDALALTALGVLPVLAISVASVRFGRLYRWHKILQTGLGLLLLSALVWFEWDIRSIDWRLYAQDSRYYDTWVMPALLLHLLCAGPSFALWVYMIPHAWKKFPRPTRPSGYSMIHKKLGRMAALGMVATAATGWLFYYLAFVC